LACAGFGILSALGWYPAYRSSSPFAPAWKQALIWELLRWELWLPMSALVLRWAKKFTARGGSMLRNTAHTIQALILFPALHCVFVVAIYGLVLGLARARDYHAQLGEEEIRTSHLEAQLAQAQLDALKMQ
jgi:hypothetical protein